MTDWKRMVGLKGWLTCLRSLPGGDAKSLPKVRDVVCVCFVTSLELGDTNNERWCLFQIKNIVYHEYMSLVAHFVDYAAVTRPGDGFEIGLPGFRTLLEEGNIPGRDRTLSEAALSHIFTSTNLQDTAKMAANAHRYTHP